MRNRQVLVVDSDAVSRKSVRGCFEAAQACVFEAASCEEARSCLRAHDITLVTLDIQLRHEDGVGLAQEIRSKHDAGIIVLTETNDRSTRIRVLEQLADDYILKPFDVHEVLARSRAVLRRLATDALQEAGAAPDTEVLFEGWTFDRRKRELRHRSGQIVGLTASQFKLLEVFVANPNRVLSRDRILELTGGSGDVSSFDRAIDMRVRRLRSKLGAGGPKAAELIRTVRGVGYTFVLDDHLH